MLRVIGVVAMVVLIASTAEALTFADVNCGATPATGGPPTQVRLDRAASSAGPWTSLTPVAYPTPTGVVTDTIPANLTTVVYRCAFGNAAGFGQPGPSSDSTTVVVVPGTPSGKPTIIIRFE